MIFSEQDKTQITEAVKKAEAKTSGELVPLVLPASGNYSFVAYRLGLVGFFLGTAGALWLHFRYPFWDWLYLFAVQVLGLAVGWALGQVPGIVRLLAGKQHMAEEVHEAALASFLRHGLNRTKERTGVLIFISLLEHRVEILADQGIHQKVEEGYWQKEVDAVVAGIRQKRAKEALVAVIGEIGAKLAQHFPPSGNNTNELSDELRLR